MIVTGTGVQGGFITKLDPVGNVVFSFANFGAYPATAAVDSNGDIYWIGSGDIPEVRRISGEDPAAGRDWMGFRANGDYTVSGLSEMPLVPAAVTLALIIGGLLASWRREAK